MILTIITPSPASNPRTEADRIIISPSATILRGTMFQLGQLGTHVFVCTSQKNLSAHTAGHSVLFEVKFGVVDSSVEANIKGSSNGRYDKLPLIDNPLIK